MDKDKSKKQQSQNSQNYEKKDSGARKFFSKVSQRGAGSSVLGIVIGILLIAAFMSMLTGGQPKTFASLLETIQDCPQIDITFLLDWIEVPRITADWEVFNFLRDFINSWLDLAGGLWSFIFFVGNGIVNFILLLIWFLRWFLL